MYLLGLTTISVVLRLGLIAIKPRPSIFNSLTTTFFSFSFFYKDVYYIIITKNNMEFQLVNLTITFLLTGLASGLIAGLLGVGGGIISVPISYFILLNLGYSIDVVMHVAIASSLGTIVFTSISSIRSHINLQNVEISVIKKWRQELFLDQ